MLTKQVMTTTVVMKMAKSWFHESNTQAWFSVSEAMSFEQVSRYKTEVEFHIRLYPSLTSSREDLVPDVQADRHQGSQAHCKSSQAID